MIPKERQRPLLAALLVVLALVAGYRLLGRGGGGIAGVAAPAAGRRAAAAAADLEVFRLDVEALAGERGVYSPGRDPFRYGPAPEPERPPTPPPAPPPSPEERAARAAERRAAQQPKPPEITLSYLGSFGPQRGRIAVFLDGKDIINAKIGDVIKNQFVLQAIGFESADLGFVEFPEEPSQRLPAGG